jgi:protein TonB
MKKIVFLLSVLFLSLAAQAQSVENADSVAVAVEETVYQSVEEQPEFPGGMKALMKYLADNIKYPRISRDNKSQGRSTVRFTVNVDGSISDAEIVRSAGDIYLDKEALRVISEMPKWKPGKKNGKPVRVKYVLPVNFRL